MAGPWRAPGDAGMVPTGTEQMSPFPAAKSRPAAGIRVGTFALAVALAGTTLAGPAIAQDAGEDDEPESISQPVVQALPSRDSLRLSAALSRLGRDPRDVNALVDAGNAAMSMGDIEAAVGFFKRANQVAPGDPRLKAGLAGATVRSGDPIGAIALFNEAERGGAPLADMAAERGLAYDLVGDNNAAQRQYRLALARGPDDEVTRRLAISQAISGDSRGLEETLLPLLRAQDKAAWRTRAFSLAIMGRTDEAVKITRTVLPEALAQQVAPYLRYMPQLTPAQQAAAANLGTFPRASDIGRDDPRILAFNPNASRPRVAAADAALVPKGEPLGGKGRSKSEKPRQSSKERRAERLAREEARKAAASQSAQASSRIAPPDVRPTRAATEDVPAPAPAATAKPPVRVAAAAVPSRPAPPPLPAPSRSQPASSTSPAQAAAVPPAPSRIAAPVESPAAILARATPGAVAPGPSSSPAAGAAAAPASAPAERPPAPVPAPTAAPAAAAPVPAPALAARTPVQEPPAAVAAPASATPSPASGAAVEDASPAPSQASVPAPGFDLARLPAMLDRAPAGGKVEAETPLPGIKEAKPAEQRQSLAEAFSDLAGPTAPAAKPAPGAVDITRITPAKPKPKVEDKPEPAKPTHPSRIWVQLGIGRDVKALAFDWRRITRKSPELFKGRSGYVSDMGQTNRMLTGPFESAKAANAFVAQLKAADFDGPYIWTSPAGQVVDTLPGQ